MFVGTVPVPGHMKNNAVAVRGVVWSWSYLAVGRTRKKIEKHRLSERKHLQKAHDTSGDHIF